MDPNALTTDAAIDKSWKPRDNIEKVK